MTHDGVARIIYLPHAMTVQDFQETANAIRTVTETRRVFTYNAARAMVVRGNPQQISMASWIAADLDQAADTQAPKQAGTHEFTVGTEDVMRVFYVTNPPSVQEFQAMANALRSTAEIRRLFTVNATKAIVARCTPGEMAMASWIVNELDTPADLSSAAAQNSAGTAAGEFRVSGAADDVVRVYHLLHTMNAQEFQTEVNQIRTVAEIRRAFSYYGGRAVTLRGTSGQLGIAENLMRAMELGPR